MMAEPGVIDNQIVENVSDENLAKMDNTEKPATNPLKEIEIKASQIVTRLEKAAEENNVESVRNQLPWDAESSSQLLHLNTEKQDFEKIISKIEKLLIYDYDEDNTATLEPLDDCAKIAIVSHSIMAYVSTLDRPRLQKLNAKLTAETTRWLSYIFRFWDCAASYHDDLFEGLLRIIRKELHRRYPRALDDGMTVLSSSLPTMYISAQSPLGALHHHCRQLGLPFACIRPVPTHTVFGSQYTMDISALQRMIGEDVVAGRTPLLVVADAGTFITGHVDNIPRLVELCKTHDIWLHLHGHALAALMLNSYFQSPRAPRDSTPPPLADSFTLNLGTWLNIPGLPMVTLYRANDSSTIRAGLSGTGRKVPCLPIWCSLQALGRDAIYSRISQAFKNVEIVWKAISKYNCIRIVSPTPGGEDGTYTIDNFLSKPINTNLLLETAVTCVVFQFIPQVPETEIFTGRVPEYYDKLNSWLGQVLQRDGSQIPLQTFDLENTGVVLRYCPLENGFPLTEDDIIAFVEFFESQLKIITATVRHKQTFKELVDLCPVLKLVNVPDWAGLGGVRYAPETWEQILTDQAKDELNRLNIALVDNLRTTDNAFSLGEDIDGLACVRFGLVTDDTDIEELLSLVIDTGKAVEENSKIIDSMTEIVKKGIETAMQDLQKENEERMWQEGILRQVPIVGTFVNWWSPKSKETGVRGRSLNLTQGVVESTENIYRYHMQLQGGQATPGISKAPPQPLIQTQVGGGSHSRSSSHSSNVSGTVNGLPQSSADGSNTIEINDNQKPL
ncbi:putative pyridoxal-dependent decarboxylase domain-containing protein 2 [Chrysoperla carnea]|uniref:putative pyridoxal-dependent decarboxylase domain-containing protein 2 n=1 Tax=Chrysoperla carnea TaxID=189513 RepID=UPI001D0684F8|nr:putative pyridoxal-dependent decarboxylase domain-containing protein 2 [Chrysoperla carnea]